MAGSPKKLNNMNNIIIACAVLFLVAIAYYYIFVHENEEGNKSNATLPNRPVTTPSRPPATSPPASNDDENGYKSMWTSIAIVVPILACLGIALYLYNKQGNKRKKQQEESKPSEPSKTQKKPKTQQSGGSVKANEIDRNSGSKRKRVSFSGDSSPEYRADQYGGSYRLVPTNKLTDPSTRPPTILNWNAIKLADGESKDRIFGGLSVRVATAINPENNYNFFLNTTLAAQSNASAPSEIHNLEDFQRLSGPGGPISDKDVSEFKAFMSRLSPGGQYHHSYRGQHLDVSHFHGRAA